MLFRSAITSVPDDEDFLDLGDAGNSAEAVFDNGVTRDREEWLL